MIDFSKGVCFHYNIILDKIGFLPLSGYPSYCHFADSFDTVILEVLFNKKKF